MILQAPYPGLTTTTVLPSPKWNDAQARQHSVTLKRAMDGTKYTHIHTTNVRHKLTYQFVLARLKALELRAFIRAYYRSQIKLTNHKGEVWRVYLTNNPFEFETIGREETVNITIECEGFLLTPSVPSC